MTTLYSILKSRDITLPTKIRLVKAMVFPVVTKFPYELRARAGGWLELLQGKRDLI